MSKNVRTQIGKVVGKSLDAYHKRMKPTVDELKFKEQYQGRIIDCMVGEVDDNYIETPETDAPVVKLEHSREGVVKIPSIKGKTILVDANGNETDTPAEGCRLVSVGEEEDNKLIILSNNKNWCPYEDRTISARPKNWYDTMGRENMYGNMTNKTNTWFYIPKGYYKLSCVTENCFIQLVTQNEIILNTNATKEFEGGLVAIRCRNDNESLPFSIKNMMLQRFDEPSNTSSSYVQHQQLKTEILLKEPLRRLPNGVCDEIVGNKIIRRLGILTFNGTEKSWEDWDENSIVLREEYFSDGKESSSGFDVKGHSNQYTWGNANTPNTFRYYKMGTVLWTMFGKDYPSQSLNEFKEKIGKHPIEVVYELAEPIIEELPNGITIQGFDDTTMYIENSITPTVTYGYNALIPYKQELSNQKEEVETNTLDIENNIIPYLLDMEFNLMLMEDNE